MATLACRWMDKAIYTDVVIVGELLCVRHSLVTFSADLVAGVAWSATCPSSFLVALNADLAEVVIVGELCLSFTLTSQLSSLSANCRSSLQ